MTTANLIDIFCILDEFCKYFTPELKEEQRGIRRDALHNAYTKEMSCSKVALEAGHERHVYTDNKNLKR